MAKRFTATEKWEDPWFCGLSATEQLFWVYLLDKCNHAGIWQVNWPLVKFHIAGFAYTAESFLGRITELSAEKWFIPKFIQFQYGTLNPTNRAHASVLAMLEKEGAYKPLARSLQGDKDKDKEKDKDKVKDKDKDKEGGVGETKGVPVGAFESVWGMYPRKLGKHEARRHFGAQVKTTQDFLDIQNAIERFKIDLRKKGTEEEFIPHGSSWFNNRWRDWISYSGVSIRPVPVPQAPRIPFSEKPMTEEEQKEGLAFAAHLKEALRAGMKDIPK